MQSYKENECMKANEIDVGDEVRIIRGDWANQVGVVTHKTELCLIPGEPRKALFNIRLDRFSRSVQKNNLDVEIVNGKAVRGS